MADRRFTPEQNAALDELRNNKDRINQLVTEITQETVFVEEDVRVAVLALFMAGEMPSEITKDMVLEQLPLRLR